MKGKESNMVLVKLSRRRENQNANLKNWHFDKVLKFTIVISL